VTEPGAWRRCSACKQPIGFGARYWVCNVSTCNRPRTALAFCSLTCWEVHLPGANHREAWALERTAPRSAAEAGAAGAQSGAAAGLAASSSDGSPRRSAAQPGSSAAPAAARPGPAEGQGRRRIVRPATPGRAAPPREVLIIASRLKDYIRARSGFNASDRILDPLSEIVRTLCDEAILKAEREGRRTVLERDIPEV
jgi:histone H3/H4